MPARNVIKPYVEESYYHIYTRGVNKANIFVDEQDYAVFLSYLKTYLVPKDEEGLQKILQNPQSSYKEKNEAIKLLRLKNFSDRIDLIAYCLMPNHFHLLIKQRASRDIKEMMQSLLTRYTMYVNARHKRVGVLFQSHYKAVLVGIEEQLLYITRYIHRNPISRVSHKRLDLSRLLRLQPSSYPNFLGEIQQSWVKPQSILTHFSSSGFTSYQSFVEELDDGLEDKSEKILLGIKIDV